MDRRRFSPYQRDSEGRLREGMQPCSLTCRYFFKESRRHEVPQDLSQTGDVVAGTFLA